MMCRQCPRLVALLVIAIGVIGTSPAQAHTELVASTPRAGDTVSMTGRSLVLVFGAAMAAESAQVVVRDAAGRTVETSAPVVSGETVELTLSLASTGRHEVAYRVTSTDGHPVVGGFDFEVVEHRTPRVRAARVEPEAAAAAAKTPGASPPGEGQGRVARWLLVAVALIGAVVLVRRSHCPA